MDAAKRKGTEQPVVFSMPDAECIWSKAGVIESTKCINAFDCHGCSLEKQVTEGVRTKCGESAPGASNTLSVLTGGRCRHMLSGAISYGLCSCEGCEKCPVEQMIEDSSHMPGRRRTDLCEASGFEVARNYYYHQGHAWARIEYGGLVRVGIDAFASRLLGEQDAIEAPQPGEKLCQGSPAVVLKRTGREAVITSPVDGVVVAVNHKAVANAMIASGAPYEEGWLMVIQPTNLQANLKNLFFDADGASWIDEEAMHLNSLLAEESSISLVVAGSGPVRDVVVEAPELGWDRLVEEFLS